MPASNHPLPPPYAPRRRPVILSSASGREERVPMWIGHMDLATAIIRAFDGGLRDGQSLSPGSRRPLLGGEHIELQYLRGLSIGMQDWKRQHPVPYELFRNLETDEVWAPPAILPYPRYRAPRPPLHKTTRAELPADLPAESRTVAMPQLPLPVNVDVYTVATLWSNQLDELLLMEDFGCWITPESANMAPISSTRVAPAARRAIASYLQDGPLPDVHLPRSAAANMFGTVFASGDKEQILALVKARVLIAPEICLLVLPNRPRDSDFVGTFESELYTRKDGEQVRTNLKNALNDSAAAVGRCVDAGLVPDLLFASVAVEYVHSRGRNLWNISLPERGEEDAWRRGMLISQHLWERQRLRYGGTETDRATSTWRRPGSTVFRVGGEPPVAPTHDDEDSVAGGGGPAGTDVHGRTFSDELGIFPGSQGTVHPVSRTRMGCVDDARDSVPNPTCGTTRTSVSVPITPNKDAAAPSRAPAAVICKRKRAETSDDESQDQPESRMGAKKPRVDESEPAGGGVDDLDTEGAQATTRSLGNTRGQKRPRTTSQSSIDGMIAEKPNSKRIRTEDAAATVQQHQRGEDEHPSMPTDDLRRLETQDVPDMAGTQSGDQAELHAVGTESDDPGASRSHPSIGLEDLDSFETLSECDESPLEPEDEAVLPTPPGRPNTRRLLPRPATIIAGQRRPEHNKQMRERAHIRIGTLNMNGRDIKRLYPRLHVRNSAHAVATLNAGIAIVLNRDHIANTETCRSWEIIPGRALVLRLEWKDQVLFLMGIYGHNDEAQAEAMWEKIDNWLTSHAHEVPRIDVMLGDMNFVEDDTDRIPVRFAGVDACRQRFQALTTRLRIRDGWRAWNAGKVEWTWRRPGSFERSRLDRIYVSKAWLDDSRDWKTEMAMTSTDHYLVSVELTNKLCPEIGRGRRAIPNSVIDDEVFQEDIHPQVMELARDVEHAKTHRSSDHNPQKVLDAFKKSIGKAALKRAKTMGSQAKHTIRKLNSERLATQNDPSLCDEEKRGRVQTLELRIAEQQIKMMRQKCDQSETRARVDGDAATGHFFAQGKQYQPKETIKSLQVPGSDPPEWKTHSPEMATIARDFYEHLQTVDLDRDGPERDDAIETALNHVNRHVSEDQRAYMAEALTYELVELSLKESANNSAPDSEHRKATRTSGRT
ncbi:hypothetical protein AURDEDRAFT_125868 [Auricularia subglabra TFB-10046 SS5]|nr:hypothetical protein AURDEDRAFT_125868 [Auricularia subglabra TFB-10046 SS5]